jgi:hypothetical protein
MEVHGMATCKEHLGVGESCGDAEHGPLCRITARHSLRHEVRLIRVYSICTACLK